METHSLASEFKIGLPNKAAFKLKLKAEVERKKATKCDPARVENVWVRSQRKLAEPKVKKQLGFCQE